MLIIQQLIQPSTSFAAYTLTWGFSASFFFVFSSDPLRHRCCLENMQPFCSICGQKQVAGRPKLHEYADKIRVEQSSNSPIHKLEFDLVFL